jgi:two-component system response regulator YesN
MMKLLIADDEYLVLDSLKMIISKNMDNVEVVGTAASGREAVEKALELKPDVIFMDIHMPGIDGMEAIRQIKGANSNALFVIITAYEFFDNAKEAINLGVSEYLLKPVNKNKVIETLNNLSLEINRRRKLLLREVELKEKINRILPFIESQFISNQLFNLGIYSDIEFYEDIFDMSLKQGYSITVLLEKQDSKGTEDNSKLVKEKQSFYELFSVELKKRCACIIGSLLPDRITAFVPVDEGTSHEKAREQSMAILGKINERLQSSSELSYKIGIGKRHRVGHFNKSCYEAYVAACAEMRQSVVYFEDLPPQNDVLQSYPMHKEISFTNRMLSGNLQGAKEVFQEIYIWLINNDQEGLENVKSKLIELLFVIEKALPNKINTYSKSKQTYILSILKADHQETLESLFMHIISELALEIQEQVRNDSDGIIAKVLKYLNNNYNKDINLDDAAKSVNMSYHYLSKIFKDEVGKNFVDYLTELRIEKSMKFLENHSMSIKEVSHSIGYNDPNYYCKIFKKITGMTPTEYRSAINIRGDRIV